MYYRGNTVRKSACFTALCFALVLLIWAVSGAYAEDFKTLLKKAERGDANAQYEVGYKYLFGGASKQDTKKALAWYEKAANNKHAAAQNELGMIYTGAGYHVKADYNKARECFLKAAALNYGNAFANLGWMYMKGRGVTIDYKQALDYFTKGANLSDRNSMMNLGWMYSQGLGVRKDDKKAREWYDKAAKISGNDTAGYPLYKRLIEEDVIYAFNDNIYTLHSIYGYGEKFEEALKERFEYNSKRAEAGDKTCMNVLAFIYSNGEGIEKDRDKALEWLKKSENFYMVGLFYEKAGDFSTARKYYDKSNDFYYVGFAYERMGDYKKAVEYYEKAIAGKINEGLACMKLAGLYMKAGNYDKALEYYEMAEASNELRDLGWRFEQGVRGGKPDYQKAFKCYEISAKIGNDHSMMDLGRMYENGIGTVKNLDKAIECYRRATRVTMQARKALARLNVPLNPSVKKNPPAKKNASTQKNPPAKKNTSAQKNPPAKKNSSPADTSPKTQEYISVPTQDNSGTIQTDSTLLNKPRVAVFSFEDKSEQGNAPADAIMNMMVTELFKSGTFTLVEREHLNYIADELKLGQSGLVDPSTAPKLGRLAGAQYIMTGAITLYYYSEKASGFVLPILGISAKAKTAYVVIDIRIIDAETGEIVYAYDQTGDAVNKEKKSLGSSSKVTGGILGLATRNAVGKHVSAMKGLNLEI